MTRLLLSILSVVLAVSIVPTTAFGDDIPIDNENNNSTFVESTNSPTNDNELSGDTNTKQPTQEDKDAQAAEQIVEKGGSSSGTTPDDNAVLISKTIEATGIEDYFDITLAVEVEDAAKDNSTAVVVVMDVSNTMNDDEEGRSPGAEGFTRSRLENAQGAANEFILEYCNGENLAADRMFGLITFNTNAQWANGLELQTVSADSTSTLQTSVNAITAPSTPAEERFTNMEAGLLLAYNALNNVNAAHKYVIFLTDGFPTTYVDRSIAGNTDSTESIAGYNPYESEGYIATKVGEDGYFADAVLGLPCTYGTSYSDKAAARAEEIASEMKVGNAFSSQVGINIFSIGIDIGAQTIQSYIDRARSTYSIVDRTSTDYVIGSASDPQAYRDWLANSIAGGPSISDDTRAYADGNNRNELLAAFADILSDIRATTGFPLPTATVSDPMGDYIEFQHFYDVYNQAADSLAGKLAPSKPEAPVENTAIFDAVANAIHWSLGESGYTLTETENGSHLYTFELSYRVRLMTEAENFPFGETLPTNDDAILVYESTDSQDELDDNNFLLFPNPSARAFADEPEDPGDPDDPIDQKESDEPNKPNDLSGYDPSNTQASYETNASLSKNTLAQTGDTTMAFAGIVILLALTTCVLCSVVYTTTLARRGSSRR